MTATSHTVAIDLGGTNVRAALVDSSGAIVDRIQRPTPHTHPEPTVILEMMSEVTGMREPGRAVIGLPGVINHETESLVQAPNIPQGWIPYLTEAWFEQRCGYEVSFANDADLAAVGEANFGAGRGERDVVYVTISTGIGAGIVVGGTLVRGALSGGEIGHTVIDRQAAMEHRPATVELLGSGTAMNREARIAGFSEQGKDFVDLVRAGNRPAIQIFDRTMTAAALGVANLCWLVVPEVVVVGGGLGRNTDLVVPIIRRVLDEHGPASSLTTRIVVAELGDDAALSGAAAWWYAVGRE
ncbi:MAG: ROK family protein [Acidimicrobiales bacterium]|nr:ROK family protein [Acidimicrobiales bacterium]